MMDFSSIFQTVIELTKSVGLALALMLGYDFVIRWVPKDRPVLVILTKGVLFGVVAVVAMTFTIRVTEGVIIDARAVSVMMSGFFGGPYVAAIAAFFPAAFRFYVGGIGAPAGIAAILMSAVFGVVLSRWSNTPAHHFGFVRLFLWGFVFAAVNLASVFAMPLDIAWSVFTRIAIPFLCIYPLGLVLFWTFLSMIERRLESDETLRQTEHLAHEAQTRLLQAINSMSEGFALWGADDRLVICNAQFRNFYAGIADLIETGVKRDDLVKTGVERGLILPAVGKERKWISDWFENRNDVTKPKLLHTSDDRVYQLRDFQTGDSGLVVIHTDVTDLIEHAGALRQSETRLRSAIESLQEGFALFDADDRLIIFNQAYQRLNPAAPSILEKGGTFEDLIRANMDRGALEEAKGEEEEFLRERVKWHSNPTGTIIRSVAKMGTFLIKEMKTPEGGIALTVVDVSELKDKEDELRLARDQAESASLAKSEFLANMSHELRTPLNSIIGFSDILAAELFGPLGGAKYREYAGDINQSGCHLLELINDVLDVSRIEAGVLEPENDTIQVDAMTAQCVQMIEKDAERATITVTRDIADVQTLMGDKRRIKQILINLLSNALKFTGPGGTITLKAALTDTGAMTFAVSDTGIGIAENDLSNVLKKFGQVENPYTRRFPGAGLGLPLAKSLAEMHNGSLAVQSEVGVGTTVIVTFPPERVNTDEP